MHKIKKRVPNYCSFGKMEEVEFSTIPDLEKIPFVKRWIDADGFKNLSISSQRKGRNLLMVDKTDGSYWAIGWISREFGSLPEWIGRPFPK